jgi:hypothetical protein
MYPISELHQNAKKIEHAKEASAAAALLDYQKLYFSLAKHREFA